MAAQTLQQGAACDSAQIWLVVPPIRWKRKAGTAKEGPKGSDIRTGTNLERTLPPRQSLIEPLDSRLQTWKDDVEVKLSCIVCWRTQQHLLFFSLEFVLSKLSKRLPRFRPNAPAWSRLEIYHAPCLDVLCRRLFPRSRESSLTSEIGSPAGRTSMLRSAFCESFLRRGLQPYQALPLDWRVAGL